MPKSHSKLSQRRSSLANTWLLQFILWIFFAYIAFVAFDTFLTIQQRSPITALIGRSAIYLLLVAIVTIALGQRLVGPISRFERAVNMLGAGNLLYRMRIRESDNMKQLERSFNLMTDSLHSKVLKDRNLAKRIAARLEELANTHKDSSPELSRIFEELKIEVEHLTSEFKV